MRNEPDEEDLVECTSAQGSPSNNAAQSKTRKEPSQPYDDEEIIRDTALKRKRRSRTNTNPLPRNQVSISFNNESGIMINENIGNTYNLTTSE